MKCCCYECEHYDIWEESCEKSGKKIPESQSEVYGCEYYEPDEWTRQQEEEKADRDSISAKQRLMLRDLKKFLKSYNAEDYQDNSPGVRAIYNVVRDMVWKCDPNRW